MYITLEAVTVYFIFTVFIGKTINMLHTSTDNTMDFDKVLQYRQFGPVNGSGQILAGHIYVTWLTSLKETI